MEDTSDLTIDEIEDKSRNIWYYNKLFNKFQKKYEL